MNDQVIEKNKVVLIQYRLSDETGKELENNHGADPMAYLHGHNNLFQVLEQSLEGKQVGEKVSQTVTPEQGYGHKEDGRQQRIPIKHIASKTKPKIGQVVNVQTQHGMRPVTVKKVGKFSVDVDTNHPFAGKTLLFDVEVLDIRDATREEIAHRHAHGVGGHQH